jgi:hypothetical protein
MLLDKQLVSLYATMVQDRSPMVKVAMIVDLYHRPGGGIDPQ